MAKNKISVQCKCGSLAGFVEDVFPNERRRFTCLCDDCQAYAHWLGDSETILDEDGGTEIFATAPAKVKLTHGLEHLKCMKLSPKGMHRWYAGCCRTAIGNTPNSKMPYVGMIPSVFRDSKKTREELIGPVIVRMLGKFGLKPLRPGTFEGAPPSFIWAVIKLAVPAFVKRQNRPTPFYTGAGEPIVTPLVLSSAEREALRPLCGPGERKRS